MVSKKRENGYKPFERDLYGCHDFLGKKRKSRNPYRRFHGYHSSGTVALISLRVSSSLLEFDQLTNVLSDGTAPELRGILEYCPETGDRVYEGKLPWGFEED